MSQGITKWNVLEQLDSQTDDEHPGLGRMLFSVAEVAQVLGFSPTKVRYLTHRGDLRCVRIRSRILYRRQDVEAFVDSLQDSRTLSIAP